MNYTQLNGFFDVFEKIVNAPVRLVAQIVQKNISPSNINQSKPDWTATIVTPALSTSQTVSTVPTTAQLVTTAAITSPVTSVYTTSKLPVVNYNEILPKEKNPVAFKTYAIDNKQSNSLLPYIVLGSIGLATLFALKG